MSPPFGRHCTLDQHQMVFAIDFYDVEIANGTLGVAMLAGCFVALLRASTTAVAGHGANRTGRTVDLLGTVSGGQPLEAPAASSRP